MTETCPVRPSVTLVEDTSYDVPRTYCRLCENAEQRNSERPAVPSGTVPLDFEGQRDAESASWERAEELDAKIEQTDELINEIVCELYGLTEEEIAIVEKAVGH